MKQGVLASKRALTFLLIGIYFVAGIFAPVKVAAAPLSTEEQKALNEYTNWVADSCSSAASGSAADTSFTPGTGAPDGAQFPNLDPMKMADSINTFISKENPNSKMKGLGQTIVADGKHSNVSPFLIVAIAREESKMSNPSDYNVSNGNNSFGRMASGSQPSFPGAGQNAGTDWYKWSSVKASVDYTAQENQGVSGGGDMAAYLKNEYGDSIASSDLVSLFLKYAPPGDNDTTAYIANVKGWVKEMVQGAGGNTPGSPPATPAPSSDNSCCPPSGTTTLTGKDAVEQTINFFLQQGLSSAQAVGIAANFMWETGGGTTIDPLVAGPTPSGDAWGIAEWTPPSNYTQDKQQAGITGDDGELQTQLEVVWAEIQGKGAVYNTSILDGLKQIDNAGDAATYFRENFEKCDTGNASCTTDRVNTANQLMQQYGGATAPSGASDTASGSGGCSATSVSGAPGTAEAAVSAAQQMSDLQIGYVWGGLHVPGQLDITDPSKLKQIGADCSGSVTWVLHQAGMFGSTGAVSGDLESWGQAGRGQEMTVWANGDHVFIEFNVPGVGHYQFNTSYGVANGLSQDHQANNTPNESGPGPQFFPWGQNGAADAASGTFTPRHWPGT